MSVLILSVCMSVFVGECVCVCECMCACACTCVCECVHACIAQKFRQYSSLLQIVSVTDMVITTGHGHNNCPVKWEQISPGRVLPHHRHRVIKIKTPCSVEFYILFVFKFETFKSH